MTRLDYLADRLGRLADALGTLRLRVREAVAAELGKAVGAAVQDVLETFARGRPAPAAAPDHRPTQDEYDEADAWADDEVGAASQPAAGATPSHPARPPAVRAAWRRWRPRCGRAAVGVALGLAAAALAECGGPVLAAGVRIAALAADLLDVAKVPVLPPGP